MEHHFNVQVAQQLGIEEAILVHNFYYWIVRNAANEKHLHNGLYWTYNTKRAYAELFPYMNETKISRVIKHLEEIGLLAKGNFNENKWDKTNWYAFTVDGTYFLKSVGYDTRLLQNDLFDDSKTNNGIIQSDLFNTNNSNSNNNNKKENSEKDKDLFEQCWITYRRKGSKKKAFEYWCKLNDVERQNVLPHIKPYVASRELQFQQDFERYLRDKTFTTIVFSKNKVIYDPTKNNGATYTPICEGALSWSDYLNCYVYVGMFYGHVSDGYTDENRPNGARIMLGNGGGFITWDSETKKWNKI